ncbi:MAG: hypothetical protein FWG50_10635, partial [Kiritimatiellaeota bacterium]|nr:hypothetical protein [Kiritimatiellota bacterium]
MKQVIRGLVGAVCLAASAVVAEDGVWTSALGGLWSDDANWADGVVAMDGGLAGFEAPGGSVQVTNDVPGLSLTGLSFNTVAGNAAGWLFDGGTVYLSGNAVADVAAGRAEFNVSVQSSGAFAKTGAGALFLEGGLVCTDGVTLWDGVMEVRSGRELGTARFNWAGGTVKVVPGVAGVQESASPNGNINLGTFGTNTMVTLDLRMAPITDEQAYPYNTQYIYRGRWYAPQDGLYSFVKDFDDQGYLAIDNVVILNNGGWNDFIVVRDVPLREGWHDIDIRVAQGTGGVGPQKGTPYGIMYDPTNGDFSSFASAVAFIDPGDGSVLRTDVQTCIAPLILLTGDVTLDASAMPTDYTPTLLRGVQTNSAAASVPKLTVTGGDGRLLIGSQTLIGTIPSHAVFNADADAANGVLFGNKVALYRLPTCDWEILPRADILIGTDGILGTGPLALTNYNVRIISENALGGPYPIAVRGEGARIIFDPTESVNGDWGNGITLTLAHDVSLEGVASAARFTGRGTCYFDGIISGAGSLIKDSGSTVHLRETNTFEGDIQLSGGRLNVYAPTIGAYTNPVVITSGATLSFNAVVEEAYVHDLSGTSGTVDIPAGQTLTLASLSMEALNVTGAGTLCVSNMTPTVRFSINGNIRLDVPDTAEIPYISLGNENITLTLTGCATLGSALGNGIIIKRGDTALTFTGAAAFDGDFVIEDGTVALDLTSTAPCEAAALWLDAADATSLDHHRNGDAVDPDKDIISRWYDKRVNGRYAEVDNYEGAQNYDRPYLLEDACNGLPVMSFGNFADPPEFHEYRRMKFNNTLNCTRVIMVFGSQQGGGHILGMTGANPIDTTFMRGGIETDETPPVASDPIWADATYPVRMDGTAVDGLSTGLSGGYQILNITLSPAHNINVIGELNSWHNAGGQRYAEALFFTSTVSDGEARVIEAYLGNKWGIPAGRVGAFTVRSGATLTVDGAVQIDSLRGDGTLVKTGTGALRLGGHFSGTIDLQGGTL